MADTTRRPSPNAAALVVLVALVLGVLLWQRPWAGDDPAPTASGFPDDPAATLTRQVADLSDARSSDALATAAGDAAWATRVWDAARALDVGEMSWRYLTGGTEPSFDDGDARATAQLTWEGGSARVDLRLEPVDGDFHVVDSLASGDDRLPLWLAGALTVERQDGVTTVLVDGGDPSLEVAAASAEARATVERTLDDPGRDLVVVSTPDPGTTAELLGQAVDTVAQIAGVSTALDSRDGSVAGPAVVLNPAVFATMDQRAREVVLAHEATHVLSGSVGSGVTTWVAEGFADYVALREDDAPLRTSAGQILSEVAEQGPPAQLPTQADFDAATDGLGAVYESAWMAFRLLGDRYGTDAVVGFYDAVLGGEPVDEAVPDAFGLSVDQLTKDWQDSLVEAAKDL